ncbi:hypothetical protein HDV02_001543 [Globomyces sp. JEL0801]|nr:hypothetical protein HDV02_001543 [Globomyces sp. JEL0801]
MKTITILPHEIIRKLLEYMSVKQALILTSTSRLFKELRMYLMMKKITFVLNDSNTNEDFWSNISPFIQSIRIGGVVNIKHLDKFKKLTKIQCISYNNYFTDEDLKSICDLLVQNLENINQLNELFIQVSLITNISILSQFVGLQSLSISGSGIEDISCLSSLIRLQNLGIHRTNIKNIDVLKKLPALQSLDVSMTNIKNLTQFNGLLLRKLDLSNNNLVDIEDLSGLNHLRELDLSYNNICDISSLNEMAQLEILNLESNCVEDIECLSDLLFLRSLNISINNIVYISSIFGNLNLEILNFNSNMVKNLDGIITLSNLKELYANMNDISDLDIYQIVNLSQLRIIEIHSNAMLTLYWNSRENFKLFQQYSLQKLWISNNRLTDFTKLSVFVNLEELNCRYNCTGRTTLDLSFVRHLTKLKSLNVCGNGIKDLDSLKNLVQLESLDLSSNQISDISDLSGLIHLKELFIQENTITNISPLKTLCSIQSLFLYHNKIIDLIPLKELNQLKLTKFLPQLEHLDVSHNLIEDITCLKDLVHFENFRFNDNPKLLSK